MSAGPWEALANEWRAGGGKTTVQWTAPNFIGGEFVEKAEESAGGVIDVVAPATAAKIGTIPRSGKKDVQAAVEAAEAALKGPWGKTTTEERSKMINRIADGLERRLPQLAALESVDQGKTVGLASTIDIPRAIHNMRFFAGAMLHSAAGFHKMAAGNTLNYTTHSRVGVVGLITPWNLPLYLLTWKVAPALAMGNTIVAKPSEITPFTATVLAEVCKEAGLPDGVFNLVHGLGAETGQSIVEHPGIKAVSFTGGTVTGRFVARTAAPLFKKLSLELGGKNPTIVFADCDFEKTVSGAVLAAFANQGEICLCGSRLLVERSIHDKFVAAFVEKVKAYKVGDPTDPSTNVGALVNEAHKAKVQGYIQKARELGGKIECGGEKPTDLPEGFKDGAFLAPTVVTGLPHDSCVSTEEIFGPVVTIHAFDTAAEAVEIANETEYGLAGSIWTSDLNTAHLVAQSLETGMVWINCWLLRDLRVPFGGVKNSGVGREGGQYSLDFFSEAKNICVDLPARL
eukprot:Rhum_TRINITY_DN9010_c0_g1::Rhum_TRINITY_DN9010_c0_g1_i1::g.31121::m.31121/K10217/dmpC, xylG, praB; aminomuconate-semialdehyde/2-hydroxymuconate-6-semialdehyde dehydrogenase